MRSISTIQDSLSPEILAQLAQVFDLDDPDDPVVFDDWIETHLGFVTSAHLWAALEMFGVVLNEDYDQSDDDEILEIPLVSLESTQPKAG